MILHGGFLLAILLVLGVKKRILVARSSRPSAIACTGTSALAVRALVVRSQILSKWFRPKTEGSSRQLAATARACEDQRMLRVRRGAIGGESDSILVQGSQRQKRFHAQRVAQVISISASSPTSLGGHERQVGM